MTEAPYRMLRAEALFAVRRFLRGRGLTEVDTPSLAASLIPERHIAVYKTDDGRCLVPSPEVHLKPLIAALYAEHAGLTGVYEIAHSFRKNDAEGPLHAREFSMLEWYLVGARAEDNMRLCEKLIRAVLRALIKTLKQKAFHACLPKTAAAPITESIMARAKNLLRAKSVCMSMEDAFARHAEIDLPLLARAERVPDALRIAGFGTGLGTDSGKNSSDASAANEYNTYEWDDVFHRVLIERVEPALARGRLVFLDRYPARIATLAAPIDGTPWAERWELYIDGIEIANCYFEETDPARIEAFFAHELRSRGAREISAPHPKNFLQDPPLPPCSGVALGIDRLVMALLGMPALRPQNDNSRG